VVKGVSTVKGGRNQRTKIVDASCVESTYLKGNAPSETNPKKEKHCPLRRRNIQSMGRVCKASLRGPPDETAFQHQGKKPTSVRE